MMNNNIHSHRETAVARGSRTFPDPFELRSHQQRILVLQGGGALGAFQAGAFEAMDSIGFSPNWVAGVSIGAINSALIAGNPPKRRTERVREFWNRVSQKIPMLPAGMEMFHPLMHRMSAASVAAFRIPCFFMPRATAPAFARCGTLGALSYYDTEPLRATLNELVDFDLINSGDVRLSLGAVNVRTGQSRYFDSTIDTITPSHVMASGALPPAFPPVEIDGEYYWDGGIMTNTPLAYVMQDYRQEALIVQVDVFHGLGGMPQTLDQAQERLKDIQYQSKQSVSYAMIHRVEDIRSLLAELIAKLPEDMLKDPTVQKLEEVSHRGRLSLIHLVNHVDTHSSDVKDYEFSAESVDMLWHAGHEDVMKIVIAPDSWHITDFGNGVRKFDL
ncbi:MAG TPA: patatin-like phospholipase family protein [Rhizomicrobium sp.]|nr:patatin-like phospholipase family protein [Rhizomicrobium sp.]